MNRKFRYNMSSIVFTILIALIILLESVNTLQEGKKIGA